MFEFIKRVFKREEPRRIPGVTYAEVSRVPVKRIEVKKFEPNRFNTVGQVENIWRYRYTDTDEIVEKPAREALDEIMRSTRPVVLMGIVK
jgi:hypothetical protein